MTPADAILTAIRVTDAGLPDMPVAPETNPVDAAVTDCIAKLLGFRATRLGVDPTMTDAKNFNQDIDALAHIFDGVMNVVGHQAQSYFGISEADRVRYFEDRVFGAFDGEGTAVVTQAQEARDEEFSGRASRKWAWQR